MRVVGVNIGLLLACTFLFTGCATVVAQLEPQLVSERLPFVQDGKTSKEEVLSRLGEPDNCYEGGRILTYKMCEEGHLIWNNGPKPQPEPPASEVLNVSEPKWFPWGNFPLSSPTSEPLLTHEKGEALPGAVRCSPERTNTLILVFGPDDLVERHSVVLVK